jgi:von Willebrand factor type A domain
MPQHSPPRTTYSRWRWVTAVGSVAVVGSLALVVATMYGVRPAAPATGCPTLRVVVAASFVPVLEALAPPVAAGPSCARLDITAADGRDAAGRAAALGADLWIPDDAAWSGAPGAFRTAAGSGAVLATSPLYLVADAVTAETITAAGGGWRDLADLVTAPGSNVRLVSRAPGGTGEGMLGLGALGEAVWLDRGMDASADALAAALPRTRTVADGEPAMPARPGEVGVVAEQTITTARTSGLRVLAPTDRTAELRYSWYPSVDAAADPARAGALQRLAATLAGPDADRPLARAGLRRPGGGPPPGAPAGPVDAAPAFDVLGPHHVDHVLATWYREDRRADVLVAVDISASMRSQAPGARVPLIDVVRQGVGSLAGLLPDDSRFALWGFGSRLDPPRDHRVLLAPTGLTGAGRADVTKAVAALTPLDTGTGLHDTILAAYLAAQNASRAGTPSHVIVFTDGRNEVDTPTLTLDQLTRALVAAADPQRPVQLTAVTFGDAPDAAALTAALKPVRGYVDRLRTAQEVGAAFIHVAAGGLHG